MSRLFAPSLAGRVFLTVILANTLILMVIFIKESFQLLETQNEPMTRYIERAGYRLDQLGSDEEARAFGQAFGAILGDYHFHGAINSAPAFPPLVEVWTQNGQRLVSANHATSRSLPAGEPGKTARLHLDGEAYDFFRHDGTRWSLRVAVHEYGFADAMLVNIVRGEFYWLPLISFSLLLLPLWFAVRHGLAPLRALSAGLGLREADDLSPVAFNTRYLEIKPLVHALNALLLELRNKVQREYAFLQDAAHELRTPLAVISAQAHVLARTPGSDDVQESLHHFDHAMARANHLITQLDELARIDAPSAQASEMLDVVALVQRDLALMASQAQARQMHISLEAPPVLLHSLEKNTFQSILHNFLGNAIRYGHVGGHIWVALQHRQGELYLSVSDDGPGIAAHERELVFERFYRHLGNEQSGAGLGLAIVRQAAARLNARLDLTSGPNGRGCCFSVRIPAANASGQSGHNRSNNQPTAS